MKTTTKELIAAIAERGVITENEIKLLNRRINAGDKEVDGIYDIDYLPLTKEQTDKAVKWLRSLHYTPTGKVRENSPFGYREIAIIDSPDIEMEFHGFFDATRCKYVRNNVPLYNCDGMEYYVEGGKINIVG